MTVVVSLDKVVIHSKQPMRTLLNPEAENSEDFQWQHDGWYLDITAEFPDGGRMGANWADGGPEATDDDLKRFIITSYGFEPE